MSDSAVDKETNLSVSGRVLSKFVEAVAEEADLSEVAARLKPVLLDNGNITEAALREALFGDSDS